ncbi:hypothetical protein OROMI_018480 [Orobanche minor]
MATNRIDDSMHIFTGHTDEVYAVVCSPADATLVATGGGDDKGYLWRIGQEDLSFELQGHKDSVSSVSFSTDGQLLASGSLDGVVKVWDTANGNLKRTLHGPSEGIEWVRWHPNRHLVLAGARDSSMWMWNADDEDVAYLNVFIGHCRSVICGDFTPDGESICSVSEDSTMKIWNPITAEIIHNFYVSEITCFTISSDSALVLTGSPNGFLCIVYIPTGEWPVTCLLWLAGTRYIATGSVDGKVRIWDSLSGDCTKVLRGHSKTIKSIASSSNGEFLVSVSIDGTARVFEIAEFR